MAKQQQQQKEQLPSLAGARRKHGRPPALPAVPAHRAATPASAGGGRAALSATLSGSVGAATSLPAAAKTATRQAGAKAASSGGAWTGRPPGKARPPELTLCRDEEECRVFNCRRAHSQVGHQAAPWPGGVRLWCGLLKFGAGRH